jgi:hypothetical protein
VRFDCWFCSRPLDPVDVLADGILEPRETSRGGPLYRFRCPGCRRENICERNARGRLLARPRETVPIFDALDALGDPDRAEENARRRAWWAKHEGIVAWFHGDFVALIDAGPWAEEEIDLRGEGGFDSTSRARPSEAPAPPPAAAADPHDVLGLPRGASREEVVAAFRRLAKEHHPDLFATRDRAAQDEAHRRFVAILDAYARLRERLG